MRTISAGLLWVAFILQLLFGSFLFCVLACISAVVMTIVAVKAHQRYREPVPTLPIESPETAMRKALNGFSDEDKEWAKTWAKNAGIELDKPEPVVRVRTISLGKAAPLPDNDPAPLIPVGTYTGYISKAWVNCTSKNKVPYIGLEIELPEVGRMASHKIFFPPERTSFSRQHTEDQLAAAGLPYIVDDSLETHCNWFLTIPRVRVRVNHQEWNGQITEQFRIVR